MVALLYTIHVLISIFLILVVLLQQGKGADLSVFGGGGTMTAFGARGAASLLHKLTVGGFVLFIVTTLSIGVYKARSSGSVMSGLPSAEEVAATAADEGEAEETATTPAAALPEAEEFEPALPEAESSLTAPEETEGDGAQTSEAPAEGGSSN